MDDRSTDLTRLRLAAALVHQLPEVSLTVWPADGPEVVVARQQCHHPDLSACALRNLVRAVRADEPSSVGLGWLFGVQDLTVDGIGVRHVGEGVVAVDHGDRTGRWWPTLLDPEALTLATADAAAAALEDQVVLPEVVAAGEIAAHVDRELGVSVVQLRLPGGTVAHDRAGDELARRLARACVISELLEWAGSGSRT